MKDSTLRDAELLIIGDRIKDLDESCIVMGILMMWHGQEPRDYFNESVVC
jgi:hypothetical protein